MFNPSQFRRLTMIMLLAIAALPLLHTPPDAVASTLGADQPPTTNGIYNWAIWATATASSTYPYESYAASRVNDESTSTALGGAESWVNAAQYAPNGSLPQWVQLDLRTPRTFSLVILYTTAAYPIQDYDVQVLSGSSWVTVASVRGNTAASQSINFAARTAQFVRILGLKGPNSQPQYVRVNEIEVY